MSHTKNVHKITDKSRIDTQTTVDDADKDQINCEENKNCTYAVTVSKKSSAAEETALCAGQKSFISIHSTDYPCQVSDIENPANLEECNVEVLSLNEVFPSTSEESLSDDESPVRRRHSKKKAQQDSAKTAYVPSNSKSSTTSGRQKEILDVGVPVHSDFDLPKNTLYVTGSNPGEPKMAYQDPPKKISKTMKKFLRNIDKHKNEQMSKSTEKAISKLTTMRGILKDGRCGPECTGDSSIHDTEGYNASEDLTFTMDFGPQTNYTKQIPDKNVSFNTQVVIIHFTGDLCVGQSIETLSKEKDQQARNSELRKTFLTKYNELWPTQK
ncbi:uncharacterized protein LOC116772402 [Danaus plexippus]|uniref:Uncharacterized protein n=1 Tax=Danaus plexippus plexippus TaxID=278856 RepID=A0A212FP92_DANPL|nr:uncharacterized protein LOC116772402 [Danaus plexippus]OWR55529.1 hypothetical protein KGM_213563 [Danaus plexippus plexippus]